MMKLDLISIALRIARSAQGGQSLRRLLPRIFALVGLSIAASLVFLVVLVGALIGLYQFLLTLEWENLSAIWLTVGASALLLAALVGSILCVLRSIRRDAPSPLEKVENIADAFMRGLKNTVK